MIVIFLKTAMKFDMEMYGTYGITGRDRRHSKEIYEQIATMKNGLA